MTTKKFTAHAFTSTLPINVQFENFVANFEKDAPLLPVELRVIGVETLTEAYFNHVGKHAPTSLLTRLADTLMLTAEEQLALDEEEAAAEYKTLNDRQVERRENKTISDRATYASGADGQSYAQPINHQRKKRLYE